MDDAKDKRFGCGEFSVVSGVTLEGATLIIDTGDAVLPPVFWKREGRLFPFGDTLDRDVLDDNR